MAIVIMLVSGFAGLAISLVALIGFDVSWLQALAIYLVATTVPAAMIMAVIYLQMLIRGMSDAPDAEPEAQRAR